MKTKELICGLTFFAALSMMILLLPSCEEEIENPKGTVPVAYFTGSPTTIVAGQNVQFTDHSTNSPTSWLWTFGDGGTSVLQNPIHLYAAAGPHNVSLKATNSFGENIIKKAKYITVIQSGSELGTVTDFELNVYKTVKIGNQWWMAENLKSTKYNDGTSIPLVKDSTAWAALSTPGYCWYNNDIANINTFGMLYNWYAVNTAKLAPTGWHVPTDAEWKQLEMTLGMTQAQADKSGNRGTDQGIQLKNFFGWSGSDMGQGNNTSGFTALPGGLRSINGNDYYYAGFWGMWWSATENDASYAWTRLLIFDDIGVSRHFYFKYAGLSVRCVRN